MDSSKFNRHDLMHLCKVSSDGALIFYSNADFLIFITIVFSYARRYHIRVTGLCIMFNHFHIAAYSTEYQSLILFYQQICSRYVKSNSHRGGKISFRLKPNSNISSKHGDKQKKTLYVYIGNNPVEKKYCRSAADYKWSFFENVPYVPSWSESKELQLAKAIVRDTWRANKPLSYDCVDHFEQVLTKEDFTDLTNYIVSTYVDIDSSEVIRLFGSVESFLHFTEHISGFDYDISEDMTIENYKHYSEMAKTLRNKGYWGNDRIIQEDSSLLFDIVQDIAHETNASCIELSRFLHIPLTRVQEITGRQY